MIEIKVFDVSICSTPSKPMDDFAIKIVSNKLCNKKELTPLAADEMDKLYVLETTNLEQLMIM